MLIFLCLLGFNDFSSALNQPKPTNVMPILKFEDIGERIKTIHVLDDDTIFLVCPRAMRVYLFQPSIKTLEPIVQRGQGPGEINGGFFGTGIVDNQMLVYTLGTSEFQTV